MLRKIRRYCLQHAELAIEAIRRWRPHSALKVETQLTKFRELAVEADWRSHPTRTVYREFLTRWIKPRWGSIDIRDVRTVEVEKWLRHLARVNK